MNKNKQANSEKGAFMMLTAVMILMFVVLLGAMVDIGRWSRGKEEIQAAGDAASLSAALAAERYVRIEVKPGTKALDECCSEDKCHPCCRDACDGDPVELEGKEVDLVDEDGWKSECCDTDCHGCSYKVLDRWVEYKDGGKLAEANADYVFNLNAPSEMEASIDKINVIDSRSDPRYPSVFVYPKGEIKTRFVHFLGINSIKAKTCSQGRTYYKEVFEEQETGKWQAPPDSRCDPL